MTSADQEAIRAGYMERLRLGLGSPFRLIDFALSDPRLDDRVRRGVASDMLAKILAGETYHVDPHAILPNFGPTTTKSLSRAARHLRVIEDAIVGSSDPRAGELAVRFAHRLAEMETSIGPGTATAAVSAAALIRDREVAAQDARRLIETADESNSEAIDLVKEWRAERRFAVERPILQAIAPRLEDEGISRVPGLLQSIRLIWTGTRPTFKEETFSHPKTALLRRLRVVADAADFPPRSSVVVSLRSVGAVLPQTFQPEDLGAWAQFERDATNEEKLASRVAELAMTHPALRGPVARGALNAAVALRTQAQERVWFPGSDAPSPEKLWERYGIRVRADADVPPRWVPYILLALDGALADLRAVIPQLNVNGLRIAITRESGIPTALAFHAPGTRVIHLPVSTGIGTVAHEIAHDLDWQRARRGNARARTYASDQTAVNGPRAYRAAVATLMPVSSGSPHRTDAGAGFATRPAEVVARTFDWFIVSRLAADGRSNGALSTVQDEVLRGHSATRPPGSSDGYGTAVIEVLMPLANVPAGEMKAFLSHYGPVRWQRANHVLSAFMARLDVTAIDIADGAREGFGEISRARDASIADLDRDECVRDRPLVEPQMNAAYRRLVVEAAAARARGLALTQAAAVGGPLARAWMAHELYGPLWPSHSVDPAMASILGDIAVEVRATDVRPPKLLRSAFDFGARPTGCGSMRHGSSALGEPRFAPFIPGRLAR